jgi:hypothetical protein
MHFWFWKNGKEENKKEFTLRCSAVLCGSAVSPDYGKENVMEYHRTKVMLRRQQIDAMTVRGLPPIDIAVFLGVPLHTVYNDLRVIRSGRYHTLHSCSRDRMVCQLYLNAMARKKELWTIIDGAESLAQRVQAAREDRLNDQYILNRLPAPRMKPTEDEAWGDETDRLQMAAVIIKLQKEVDELREIRLGREAAAKRKYPLDEKEKAFVKKVDAKLKEEEENKPGYKPPLPPVRFERGTELDRLAANADPAFFEEFEV